MVFVWNEYGLWIYFEWNCDGEQSGETGWKEDVFKATVRVCCIYSIGSLSHLSEDPVWATQLHEKQICSCYVNDSTQWNIHVIYLQICPVAGHWVHGRFQRPRLEMTICFLLFFFVCFLFPKQVCVCLLVVLDIGLIFVTETERACTRISSFCKLEESPKGMDSRCGILTEAGIDMKQSWATYTPSVGWKQQGCSFFLHVFFFLLEKKLIVICKYRHFTL